MHLKGHNMQIQITEKLTGPHGTYISATCGNVSAFLSIHSWGLQVCCQNAAHKCYRGSGKHYASVAQALAGYKSGEMQAIIRAAVDAASPPQSSSPEASRPLPYHLRHRRSLLGATQSNI